MKWRDFVRVNESKWDCGLVAPFWESGESFQEMRVSSCCFHTFHVQQYLIRRFMSEPGSCDVGLSKFTRNSEDLQEISSGYGPLLIIINQYADSAHVLCSVLSYVFSADCSQNDILPFC